MKPSHALIALSPLLAALLVTYFIGVRSWGALVAYFVVLDMTISLLSTALFVAYWRRGREYEDSILRRARTRSPVTGKYRIAILIPVFNEPPRIVAETAAISKAAVEGLGDVYVLDDSTDEEIRRRLDQYSREVGFRVVRRASRRGYKAGAVNSWLRTHGGDYDYVTVMDADQRLIPGVFEYVMKFFDDPDVAFVQIPQYYSSLDSAIALSAYLQQLPFLRVIMRGRHLRGSAFSLGSGTIYRVKHLISVGGLNEETVTEDIYTSVLLHERGYRSVYVDLPFVWNGEAPHDLPSYMSQQNRWALGTFQLLRRLLGAKLSPSRFLDYLNGLYYWIHVSLLTIIDIAAPVLFLLLGIYFMSINPVAYLLVYLPIVIASLVLFLRIMTKYGYGKSEFMYHQGIQSILSLPVTMAFLEWITRRRKGFAVTPKGAGSVTLTRYHVYYASIVAILAASVIVGILRASTVGGLLLYAYVVNIFWATWWLAISSYGLYISLSPPAPREMVVKVAQAYEGLEWHALRMLVCAVSFEAAIADHYMQLSRTHRRYSERFRRIAMDSYRHAKVYHRLLESLGHPGGETVPMECEWTRPHMEEIVAAKRGGEGAGVGEEDIGRQILVSEEILMSIYAKLVLETCRYIVSDFRDVEGIIEDEEAHERILREIAEEIGQQ